MLFALALTLLAGLSTSIGAAIAVGHRNPGPKFMAGALGLSAGVMLYVSFVEILPQGVDKLITAFDSERTGTWLGVGAFFLGIAIIAVIDRLVPEEINPHEPGTMLDDARRARLMKTGVFAAAALAFHNFPEGFATFLAGLEDASIALPVAFAIAIHNIPEGIAVAVPLRQGHGLAAQGVCVGDAVRPRGASGRRRGLCAALASARRYDDGRGFRRHCRHHGVHFLG